MLSAEILEILPRDKQHFRVFRGRSRSRIISTVENRQFRKRTSRSLHGKRLLPPAGREFEDTDFSFANNKKPPAGVALTEEQLAAVVVFTADPTPQCLRFFVGQTGKQRGLSQHRFHSVTHDPALLVLAAARLTTKRHDSSVRGSLPKDDRLSNDVLQL